MVHHQNNDAKTNLSDVLSSQLHHDYNYLSNLFSEIEGTTIEKYFIAKKIEKVKEIAKDDEYEKFRDDDKEEYYDELQEELIMDWKYEGEYSLEIEYKTILDNIDEVYVCGETGRI